MNTTTAAYEFPEADAAALRRADCGAWPVGGARVYERVKIRDAEGVHVANGFLEVADADD